MRDKEETKALFLENKNQLVYSTPSILLNSLSFSVVVFFIGILYTNTEVGIYGMAIRVLGIPVTIISLGLSKYLCNKPMTIILNMVTSEIYYLNLVPYWL